MADNTFSTAQIKVEAETTKAEQALKDLRGKMDELGKSLDDLAAKQREAGDASEAFGRVDVAIGDVKRGLKDVSDLMSVLAKLEAPIRLARDFFQLGTEIEGIAEKLLGIPDAVGEAMTALANESKSPIAITRQQIAELQKEWLDGGIIEQWKRAGKVVQDAIFGTDTEAEYDRRFSDRMERLKKSLRDQQEAEQKAAAELAAKKLDISLKSTEERLNLEYQMEVEAAKKKYGSFAGPVIEGIAARKAAEIEAAREVEEKRKQAEEARSQKERDEIAERRRAYDDLIRDQEAKRIASEERIAERTQQLTSQMLASISQQFNQLFDIRQMTMTLEAVNANLKALVNKRQGF